MRLNAGNKGRVIAAAEDYPARFAQECVAALGAAVAADPTVPPMEPTVVLTNFYSDRGGTLVGWCMLKPVLKAPVSSS